MSFTDTVYQPTLVPDLNNPQETFDPQALVAETNTETEQELDGGQQPYDSAQASRIVDLLRELGRTDIDAEAKAEIEAELADLGIADPMGGTTPQLVAQLLGVEDYANATQDSVTDLLIEQGYEIPENFWNVGLDQNWQVLDAIVAENSRQPLPITG